MRAADYPNLAQYVGQDLILTGGSDKHLPQAFFLNSVGVML